MKIRCRKRTGPEPRAKRTGNESALSLYDGCAPPRELQTSVALEWDEKELFVRFQGAYSRLHPADPPGPSEGKTPRLWEISDVFEAFISWETDGIYREFQVSPDGRYMDIAIDGSGPERLSDFQWNSGMKVHSSAERGLWTSLMKIPWSAFAGKPPEEGDCWSGNFFRISGKDRDKAYLSWSPVYKIHFHQPQYFGKILFTA